MKIGLPKKQKGAAAIEFALVFMVFFTVLYGVLSYSLPLLLLQSFNNSTAEAVRRSVAVDPTTPDYNTAVETMAKGVLTDKLSWVPPALNELISKKAVYDASAGMLTVTVSLKASDLSSILPVLTLGSITVPSLPDTLASTSSLKF